MASKLKQITTEAKKLYKTGKYKKWTDAIKAASKKISGTGTDKHTDSKSHNVNIRVVSGVKEKKYKGLKIIQSWNPSNYHGTMKFKTTLPNGKSISSSSWDNLKKQINKNLTGIGAVKIIQKGQSKNAKVTKVLQQVRTKSGTFKGYKSIKGIGNVPKYSDPAMAYEIQVFADSDSALYFSRKLPILKNLERKYKKGNYKIDMAAKLWLNFVNDALQRYNKEFGSRSDKWHELMTVPDRKLLAMEYAIETKNEFDLGNFIVQ